ncbi:tumor necrosis factor receptor superfamily member 5-like, partial [Mustelus asterias]
MKLPRRTCELLSLLCLLGHWVSRSKPHPLLGGHCDQSQEYYSEDREDCCKKCPPGFYASQRCTKQSETQCKTCPHGEYTAFWNYVRECNLCSHCDHRRGLVVKRNCTNQHNTECQCGEGHHCAPGKNCAECDPHSDCGPGQEQVQQGSPTLDTVCKDCPPGTFQSKSTFEKCRNHKNCTAFGLIEWKPGSLVSDSVCAERMWTQRPTWDPQPNNSLNVSYVLIALFSTGVPCFAFLVVFLLCSRKSRICGGSKRQTESQ